MVVPVTLSWSAGSVGKACTITGSAELMVLMDIEQTDTRRDDNTPPTTVVANLPIDSSFWNVPTSYSVGITSFFNLFILFIFCFFCSFVCFSICIGNQPTKKTNRNLLLDAHCFEWTIKLKFHCSKVFFL